MRNIIGEERFDADKRIEFNTLIIKICHRNKLGSTDSIKLLELLDYIAHYRSDEAAFRCCIIIVDNTPSPIVYKKALSVTEKLLPLIIYHSNYLLRNFIDLIVAKQNLELNARFLDGLLVQILDDPRQIEDVRGLLYIICEMEHPRLKQLALKQLERVKVQQSYLIADWWYFSRNPTLEQILLSLPWQQVEMQFLPKILLALKTGQFAAIGELSSIILSYIIGYCTDQDPVIAHNAQIFLGTVDESYLIEVVGQWARNRTPQLLQILNDRDYLPNDPDFVLQRVLLALKLGKNPLTGPAVPLIPYLLKCVEDQDGDIATRARQALLQLSEQEAREILCEMVIKKDLPVVKKIVLEAGYLPADLTQRALFYFITEQWEAYEALDFDQSRLKAAYRQAEPQMQRRIGQVIRKAGKVEYLNVINRGNLTQPASISGKESGTLIQVLMRNEEWSQLWSLITEIPVRLSWQVIRKLAAAEWQPASAVELAFYEQLQTLRDSPVELDVGVIKRYLKPEQEQALNWATLIAIPLSQSKPSDLAELLAFRAIEPELPEMIENALDFAEAVLRYRFRHAVELVEASEIPSAQFDIEIESNG